MSGALLGFSSAALALGSWFVWLRRLQAVRIPRDRRAFHAAMGVALLLGIAAFVSDAGTLGRIAAGLGVASSGMYLGLRLQSTQDAREPAVKVGGSILDFSAPDDADKPFSLSSLRGRPFLLKFFRGHW